MAQEEGGRSSRRKADPELYPPEWTKLVPTCVRLNPGDWNKFQTHPELQGRMSEVVRDLVHNYLAANGFSESALIAKLRDLDGKIRVLTGEKAGMEMQLQSMLTQKFDEEEAALDTERRSLMVVRLKIIWAEQLYILRKSASLQSKERSPQEDLDWIGQKLKGTKELKDQIDTPENILKELEKIIVAQKDQFEIKFQETYTSPRRGHKR